jgi:hypothetical protein
MQAAKGCIRELKQGVSRLMIKTGFPKKLWNHCIILMEMIRSSTTNSIYMTAGQVPETIMTGETADISQICQFGWFDWVMYHDPAKFPDNKMILGRYLGPAIDVGSMLTCKILLPNGQYVCRSTLRHLNNDERNSEVHKAQRLQFDQAIKKLGPKAQPIDFDEQNLTPEHIHYGEDADSIDSDHGNLEITPELGGNYIGAEILIPRGGVFLRGRVARRKRDANGNPIGRSHDSPPSTCDPTLWSLTIMTRQS